MERHEILQAMSELKLYGIASFDEVAGKGLTRRDDRWVRSARIKLAIRR